jgi:alkylhydroperoxidase family enzyme
VVAAALADLDAADLSPQFRAMARFLAKVTLEPEEVGAADARAVREAGVGRQAMEDALMVCFCFSLITRLADAFGWHIPDEAGFQASGKSLLDHGYLMPLRGKPLEMPAGP